MSTQTRHVDSQSAGSKVLRGLRLWLKPAHRSGGFVHGAWWPQSTQLHTELPPLLGALLPRLGHIDRVIYDENSWAPASLRLEFRGSSVILEGSSTQPIDTLSVLGEKGGKLVLLVVPPDTAPTRAYTTVMRAADPGDMSTADELLGTGAQTAEDRRLALMAHQRWEAEGGALRRTRHTRGGPVSSVGSQEVRGA